MGGTHAPLRHIVAPPLHGALQLPQLCESFCTFTHAPLHAERPFDVHDAASNAFPSDDVPSVVASAPPSITVVVPPQAKHMHNASKALMPEG